MCHPGQPQADPGPRSGARGPGSRLCGRLAALAGMTLLLVGTAASAQTYRTPRTTFGQPDLQGVWTNETLTRFERPAEYQGRAVMTADEVVALERPGVWRKVMRVRGEARTSLLTTPDGRVPPLKAGA